MKPTQFNCPACRGTGKKPISREHAATLRKIVRRSSRGGTPMLTSTDLHEDGVSHAAICKRLTDLESFGLIQRAGKRGKSILWTSTPTAK